MPTTVIDRAAAQTDPTDNGPILYDVLFSESAAAAAAGVLSGAVLTLA